MYHAQGIYNILDVTGGTWVANDQSSSTAMANFTTLQTVIGNAQVTGGIVLLPCVDQNGTAGTFYLQSSATTPSIAIDTSTKAPPIVVFGYGGATTLFKLDDGDIFVLTNQHSGTRGPNPQGIIFTDLQIQYPVSLTSATGIAFSVASADNLLLRRIYFENCPNALSLLDCLQASVYDCTVEYSSSYANSKGGTAITLAGSGGMGSGCEQFSLEKCVLRVSNLANSGPINGIVIGEATHGKYTDTAINGFSTGVAFTPTNLGGGANTHTFTNVTINPGTGFKYAVLIEPQGDSMGHTPGTVQYIKFVGCDFSTNATDVKAAVYINANSASGGDVDSVEFIGCSVNGFNSAAIWAVDGTRINIIGGVYKNNVQSGTTPKGQITVVGPVTKVNIIGVSSVSGGQYGIDITNGATFVYVRDCNLKDNASGPINFGSGLSSSIIEVTNCAAYNDAQTIVYGPTPITTAHQSAALNGYYGPSLVTCQNRSAGTTSVTVNNQAFTVQANDFFSVFLKSPYDTILFSSAAAVFTWIGE